MAGTTALAAGASAINPLLGLAVTLAPSVYQGILGANQDNQANSISPGARPKYEIPSAEKAALNLQRMLASSNAPGYTQAKEDVEAGGANALLQTMKFGTPNVAQMYKNKTDALVDLNINNETYRERQLGNLTNKLSEYAGFQEKEFDINKMQPYNYAMQQSMDLKDASNQNIYGALDQGGAGIITAMQLLNGGTGVTNGTSAANNKVVNTNRGTPVIGGNKGVVGESGVPLATDFTDTKAPVYENLSQLSDALKQQAATSGGVVTPESNKQIDAMLSMLISNPNAMAQISKLIEKGAFLK